MHWRWTPGMTPFKRASNPSSLVIIAWNQEIPCIWLLLCLLRPFFPVAEAVPWLCLLDVLDKMKSVGRKLVNYSKKLKNIIFTFVPEDTKPPFRFSILEQVFSYYTSSKFSVNYTSTKF
jgi:hypothetical protein